LSGFKNLGSFEEFCDVAEKYWNVTIFPNIYFPRIAPIYPLLILCDDNTICFNTLSSVFSLATTSFFHNSYEFIFKSKYKDRVLPKDVTEKLGEQFYFESDFFDKRKKEFNIGSFYRY